VCSTLGLPLVSVAIVISLVHYLLDEQYNQGLLFDLVAQQKQPAPATAPALEAVV
jgi:hypothetical protein